MRGYTRPDYTSGIIQPLENLNEAVIHNDDGPDIPIRGNTTNCKSGNVEVLFTGLQDILVAEIQKWPVVIGCVAWLTNDAALKALATRRRVSVLVNKEDFLRPDSGNMSEQRVKKLYSAIPGIDRAEFGAHYNCASDPDTDAVRCVGVHGRKDRNTPRMHHKFLVFCEATPKQWYPEYPRPIDYLDDITPQVVWTGSFNITYNACHSLENAIIIRDSIIAAAYFNEWYTLLGLSEPLDWESPYVAPEYRLGT